VHAPRKGREGEQTQNRSPPPLAPASAPVFSDKRDGAWGGVSTHQGSRTKSAKACGLWFGMGRASVGLKFLGGEMILV
jgi:hypothetical protein